MTSKSTPLSSATPKVDDVPNSGQDDIRSLIADTVTEFGSPKSVVDGIDGLIDKVAVMNSGLTVWFKVAVATKQDGSVTAREFGELTGTDKNWLGRLIGAAMLWKAHEDKGLRLSPRDAVKVANVKSLKDIVAIVTDVKRGRDPLGTKGGAVKPSKGEPRKRSGASKPGQGGPNVDPKDYARVLEFMVANVDKVSDESKRRMLTSALALVDILTDEGVRPIDVDEDGDAGTDIVLAG